MDLDHINFHILTGITGEEEIGVSISNVLWAVAKS